MKVCIQNLSRVWGGNEKWLATLAEGLLAEGVEVVVSCRPGAVRDELRGRGVPTTDERPGVLGQVGRGVRFARWLRRERPDALLLTSWKSVPWGSWAGRRAGARVVVRLGIRRVEGRLHPARIAIGRWVDAVIVNSEEIRDGWLSETPETPPERVRVVLNSVAPPALDGAEREALRQELGGGAPVLACAGFLERRKGIDLLVESLPSVPDASLVVIGNGSQRAALQARAAALGVVERVRWLGHRPDAARLIAACDLFVLPSRNEGMANVMLEAMAAGVPVVGAAISGVRGALAATGERPPAGWMVPPEDVPGLAGAVRDALASPEERAARGAEAARRAREWFGSARMVRECMEILLPGAAAR